MCWITCGRGRRGSWCSSYRPPHKRRTSSTIRRPHTAHPPLARRAGNLVVCALSLRTFRAQRSERHMDRFIGLLGVLVMIGLGLTLSFKRRDIRWRPVFAGVLIQIALAAIILRVPGPSHAFHYLGEFVNTVI